MIEKCSSNNSILGGVLAGGLSRRMGGLDKSLVQLDGIPLLYRVISRLEPQVSTIVINANGDPRRFAPVRYRVVADIVKGFAGPLAGIHALLDFATRHTPDITHVATVAADTPFFPENFVEECAKAAANNVQTDAAIVLAKSNQNRHPVFGLWPIALLEPLAQFLKSAETRKVMAFVQMHPHSFVDFPFTGDDDNQLDPFFNINEPRDLDKAQSIICQPLFAGHGFREGSIDD